MKTTYNLILAAFAAAMALSSCAKEIVADKQEADPADGLRTIEVSFETPTRTVLDEDDMVPVFKKGDKIMVANGEEWEECTVTPSLLEKGSASFTTKLSGDLCVVYPSKAAIVKNGYIKNDVKVSSNQSGRFEDANIASGTCYSGAKRLTLYHCTAVLRFYVGQSIGVDSLVIEASNNYLANGQFDEKTGNRLSDKPSKKVKIVPQDGEDVCYAAVRAMYGDTLTVRSYTKTQTVENEGGLVARRYCPVFLTEGNLVDVFIPYYIEVQVGDATQRWGYCNVGAFRPKEVGKYFAWGSKEGFKWDEKNDCFKYEHVFNWTSCPFNGGAEECNDSLFNANIDSVCPEGILDPKNDAAFEIWKGYWRMPRKDEIDSLYAHVPTDAIGEKGLTIGKLFFPLTGFGTESFDESGKEYSYVDWDDCGMYWTSSLYDGDLSTAYCFNFTYHDAERGDPVPSGFKKIGENFSRRWGMPIRPIFDFQQVHDVPLEPINKYIDGGDF